MTTSLTCTQKIHCVLNTEYCIHCTVNPQFLLSIWDYFTSGKYPKMVSLFVIGWMKVPPLCRFWKISLVSIGAAALLLQKAALFSALTSLFWHRPLRFNCTTLHKQEKFFHSELLHAAMLFSVLTTIVCWNDMRVSHTVVHTFHTLLGGYEHLKAIPSGHMPTHTLP